MGPVSKKCNDQLTSSIPLHATWNCVDLYHTSNKSFIFQVEAFTSAMPHCTVNNRSAFVKQNY